MAKKRNNVAAGITLKQPDRSAPTKQTLLQLAGEKDLFKQAELRQRQLDRERRRAAKKQSAAGHSGSGADSDSDGSEESDDSDGELSPRAEQILDTLLWGASLAMLHFTFDVLVQHQYAVAIRWPEVIKRTLFSFPVFCLLFYSLHAHPTDPTLLPFLSPERNARLRQVVFFTASTLTGCYLVLISNRFGYMAVMKQAPPIGCIWVWSVIELSLGPGVGSLALVGSYMWLMGYWF